MGKMKTMKILDMVPARMAQNNVSLKPSECFLGVQSVEFLGHIFNENGVKVNPVGSRI